MKETYLIVPKVLVILGALNWLAVGAFNVNLVQSSFLHNVEHALYVLIGISAILLATQRDFFLPFLGRTVFPQSLVTEQVPQGADTVVTIRAPPGAKVVYWAAENSKQGYWDTPNQAYGFYQNTGVVTANALGQAHLKVRSPSGYSTPWVRKQIAPHVHYRIEDPHRGMWGAVQTVPV